MPFLNGTNEQNKFLFDFSILCGKHFIDEHIALENKNIRNLRGNFFYYILYRLVRKFLNKDIKVKIYNFFVWCSFRKNKMSHSIIRKCDFEDLKELNLIKIFFTIFKIKVYMCLQYV